VWLRLVCDWLGGEFARLRTTINQHVDVFKADHIDRISDLPSARTVVRRLFPHCMIMLMLHWMGSTASTAGSVPQFTDLQADDCSQPEGSSIRTSEAWSRSELDHNYVADDCQESTLFSFIQLILEFANGCLVSGIAHVLYPRLLQAQL